MAAAESACAIRAAWAGVDDWALDAGDGASAGPGGSTAEVTHGPPRKADPTDVRESRARERRPPRKSIRGAKYAPRKAAPTKARVCEAREGAKHLFGHEAETAKARASLPHSKLERAAGSGGGRPRPLEIEAA